MKKTDAACIRFCDFLLALVLLPCALAFFVLLLIPQLICFGKIFYTDTRTGQQGGNFLYVKLQSMKSVNGQKKHGRAYLEAGRIPAWGRFLRKTHLDELPEIFFILAGRESFAGPRPLLAEHVTLVDSPERRLLKPGWTGLSQIFLKTRGILPSRIQRRLDKKLGRELCFPLYIKIICATAAAYFCQRKKYLSPGPTVIAYRRSLQEKHE